MWTPEELAALLQSGQAGAPAADVRNAAGVTDATAGPEEIAAYTKSLLASGVSKDDVAKAVWAKFGSSDETRPMVLNTGMEQGGLAGANESAGVLGNVMKTVGQVGSDIVSGQPLDIPKDVIVGTANTAKAVSDDTGLTSAITDAAGAVGDAAGAVGGAMGVGGGGGTGAGMIADERQRTHDFEAALAAEKAAAGQHVAPTMTAAQQRAPMNVELGMAAMGPAAQMQAAQVGPMAQAQAAQAVDTSGLGAQQLALVKQLQDRAAGRAPSAAELQMRAGLEQAQAQAMAQGASARGANRGLAARNAMRTMADLAAKANTQMGTLRAQEQAQATGQLGDVMQGARGQELQLALTNAGYGQQANLANTAAVNQGILTQAELAQRAAAANQAATNTRQEAQTGANLGVVTGNVNRQTGVDTENANRTQDANKTNVNSAVTTTGQNITETSDVRSAQGQARGTATNAATGQQAAEDRDKDRSAQLVGGVLSGVASIGAAAASDVRVKRDVRDLADALGPRDDLADMLEKLRPAEYRYTDPAKYGEGRRVGVMAQDLEKSPAGRTTVFEDGEGVKRIDTGAAVGAALAAMASMHQRLKDLEQRRAR